MTTPSEDSQDEKKQNSEKAIVEFSDGQKSQIKILMLDLLWKFSIGIIFVLGGVFVWYINYKTASATDEILKIKIKGEETISEIKTNSRKTSRIVALISDFGSGAYYLSNFKGRILKEHPNANLIDISHEIRPFDVTEGAWVLANSAKTLPDESIIWGIVNPGADLRHSIFVVTKKPRHYLIGASENLFDNVIKNEDILAAYKPRFANDDDKFGTKTFAELVNALLAGDSISQLKEKRLIESEETKYTPYLETIKEPVCTETCVTGNVCSIDRWGNVLTNISQSSLFQDAGSPQYDVTINGKTLSGLVYGMSYSEGKGKPGVIMHQDGWLQIAIYMKAASNYFDINLSGSKVKITKKK